MMRKKEKPMIDFIAAKNGGIELYAGAGNLKGWGKTPEGIAYTLKTVGLAEVVMGGSTMDFAIEEGFTTNAGALDLWDEAIAIYNWEVNGVAS